MDEFRENLRITGWSRPRPRPRESPVVSYVSLAGCGPVWLVILVATQSLILIRWFGQAALAWWWCLVLVVVSANAFILWHGRISRASTQHISSYTKHGVETVARYRVTLLIMVGAVQALLVDT